jgi:hypothetical protein
MTASRDPDRLIRAFLDQGEELLPDPIYDALRAEIEHKRQRTFIGPWRTPIMNRFVTFSLGAAAVVVIGLLLGSQLLGSPTNLGGPSEPTATPMVTATPQPSAEPTSTPQAGLPQGPFSFEPDGDFSEEDSGMALTVTIPSSGWFFDRTWNLLGKGAGEIDSPYIAFWAFPGQEFYVPGDACRMRSTRPDTPATTPDELSAALAARTPPDVSEPVDVTVGGYEGKFITLHVPEDLVADECEEGDFVYYITSPDDFWRNSQEPGQIEEFWILDVDGTIVILNALYRSDTPAELVEETRGIVESTTFEAP